MMRYGQSLELLDGHPHFDIAVKVIKRLVNGGHAAVFAGGCVRDSLLGISPHDLDIATSAPPEQVESLFTKTLAVGKDFGTIVVVENGCHFEVTTFRTDGDYLDGRRPSSVTFTDMEQDAERRDFTINALFYDPLTSTVIDFVKGLKDLQEKKIKTVGVAAERFNEDKLRMLRAVRFVGQLDFVLDGETVSAIKLHGPMIEQVSVERVFIEVKKLLGSLYPVRGVKALMHTELFKYMWPEIEKLNADDLRRFPCFNNWETTFVAIFFLCNGEDWSERLRVWKAPRESSRKIQALIDAIRTLKNSESSRVERLRVFGSEQFADLVSLCQGLFEPTRIESWIREYLAVAAPSGELPKPFISGDDLLALGFKSGAEMGRVLKEIFERQLEGRIADKESALKWAKTQI